jgi:hypothetical protein
MSGKRAGTTASHVHVVHGDAVDVRQPVPSRYGGVDVAPLHVLQVVDTLYKVRRVPVCVYVQVCVSGLHTLTGCLCLHAQTLGIYSGEDIHRNNARVIRTMSLLMFMYHTSTCAICKIFLVQIASRT